MSWADFVQVVLLFGLGCGWVAWLQHEPRQRVTRTARDEVRERLTEELAVLRKGHHELLREHASDTTSGHWGWAEKTWREAERVRAQVESVELELMALDGTEQVWS